MSENISSNNQSGGITAHTVHIGSTAPAPIPEKPKPNWKKVAALIAAAIAFVASVVAVLDYFDVKPKPDTKIEKKVEPERKLPQP